MLNYNRPVGTGGGDPTAQRGIHLQSDLRFNAARMQFKVLGSPSTERPQIPRHLAIDQLVALKRIDVDTLK
jgi:hypothetical protein